MTKLKISQLLALEKGVKKRADDVLTRAYHLCQKPAPFAGLSRKYTPKRDDGEQLPPESTRVQAEAKILIAQVSEALARLFDITATKDFGNCSARGDIVVNGTVLVSGVPVTTLLSLDKSLTNLLTFVKSLPALDPAEKWEVDSNTGWQQTSPVTTVRTKKVPRNHVKAEATDKHPAQVEVYHEDVPEGYWETVKYSGALPATTIQDIQKRVEELHDAVLKAREKANTVDVEDVKIGEQLLGYVFAGV